jgi:hypothetical protein
VIEQCISRGMSAIHVDKTLEQNESRNKRLINQIIKGLCQLTVRVSDDAACPNFTEYVLPVLKNHPSLKRIHFSRVYNLSTPLEIHFPFLSRFLQGLEQQQASYKVEYLRLACFTNPFALTENNVTLLSLQFLSAEPHHILDVLSSIHSSFAKLSYLNLKIFNHQQPTQALQLVS